MAEHSSPMEPFGVRLDRLLRAAGQSQAWLVKHAHLSSSVVSRLIRCERLPTFEHVAAMAPLLGMSVDVLVAGTDAEARITEASQYVSRAHFESAHRRLVAAESDVADVERHLQRVDAERARLASAATTRQRELSEQLERTQQKLEHALRELTQAQMNKVRMLGALSEAVADVAVLQGKLAEVQAAAEQGDRARMAAALTGWSAVGKRNAAEYLGKER